MYIYIYIHIIYILRDRNVVMVATDICRKSPSWGSGYMGLRENVHF